MARCHKNVQFMAVRFKKLEYTKNIENGKVCYVPVLVASQLLDCDKAGGVAHDDITNPFIPHHLRLDMLALSGHTEG